MKNFGKCLKLENVTFHGVTQFQEEEHVLVSVRKY